MANQERIPLIALAGPEGSGKTTQGKILAKQLNLLYFSTGERIRDAIKSDTTWFGDACRDMKARHAYLDPKLIIKMLGERFSEEDAKNGVILDGGFRTLEETENFRQVSEISKKNFAVLLVYLRLAWYEGANRIIDSSNQRDRDDDNTEEVVSHLKEFSRNLGSRMGYVRNNYDFETILCHGKSIEKINLEILTRLQKRVDSYP